METKRLCSQCGNIIYAEDFVEVDGEIVCQDCFNENYFYCDRCGKIELQEDGTHIQDTDLWVCEYCRDYYYHYCEDCHEYFEYTTYIEGYGDVCQHCYEWGDFHYCERCECYYHIDDFHYCERNNCYYCDDCYDETEDLVYDYHEFDNWHFYKGSNEETAPYYIGKEIELEPKGYSNVSELLNIMNNNINAVGMHDGSLCNGGVEVVTHPESWKYLQEHKENYRRFFNQIEGINYGDNGDTGLHFHVSRPNEDVIARLFVIIESFKDEIKKLSRRKGFGWCEFASDDRYSTESKISYTSVKYIKDKFLKERHDRHVALNINNNNTIEFRFFNGANNFEEFWGALQFIHNLMEVALDTKRGLNTITWKELLNGDELQEQAKKQGVIDINKKVKETSDIIEKIEKIQEETKKEIKRTLKNFIKYISKEIEGKKLEYVNRNNIDEIERTTKDYLQKLYKDLNCLESLSSIYRYVDDNTIDNTKYRLNDIKEYSNKVEYNRYFKQIDKTIEKYNKESEELI